MQYIVAHVTSVLYIVAHRDIIQTYHNKNVSQVHICNNSGNSVI